MSEKAERSFYPLIGEKLKKFGKVTCSYRLRQGDFNPDFIVEDDHGNKMAVEVGCELHKKHLVPKILCRQAFQLQVYLQRFNRVLYIAPPEELKIVCDMLQLAGVRFEEKLLTADLGYMTGENAFEARIETISSELRKLKKAMRSLEYKI